MYLKTLCFVSVLVAVYASNFDEELPVYLSDDILISKLPTFTKRSLSNTAKVDLVDDEQLSKRHTAHNVRAEDHTGSIEKIVKRDTTPEQKSEGSAEQKRNEESDGHEIENTDESGLVFLPSFGRRTRRSISKNDEKDLLNSESNIVFLPSFKRKGFRRFRRDVPGSNYKYHVKRSAENRNERDEGKKTETSATEQNEELSDSDTINRQESGLVFLPSFGRRSRRNIAEGSSSTPEQQKTQDVTFKPFVDEKHDQQPTKVLISHENNKRDVQNSSEQKKVKLNNSEEDKRDEDEEESGLVFLPSFGRRFRRSLHESSPSLNIGRKASSSSPIVQKHDQQQIKPVTAKKPKREVKSENTEKKEAKHSESDAFTNDESAEESGLVFLPSFGRRPRRSVADRSNSSSTQRTTSTTSRKDGNDRDQIKNHDQSEGESGLVFLPSFGRRHRRDTSS